MKKLKLKGTLLQHAEKMTRQQQKAILGGYGGGGGTGCCTTIACLDQNHNVIGRVNEAPVCCGTNLVADMQKCVDAGIRNVWWTNCCL